MSSEPSESVAMAKGVEHLQTAALEMISAARAFLDVVEDLVTDPDKVGEVMSAVGTVAATVTDAARRADGTAKKSRPAEPATDGVQRIRVS